MDAGASSAPSGIRAIVPAFWVSPSPSVIASETAKYPSSETSSAYRPGGMSASSNRPPRTGAATRSPNPDASTARNASSASRTRSGGGASSPAAARSSIRPTTCPT